MGQKGKNNGLLLLIAWQREKIRIEVGYGLEPTVTDAFSVEVIRELLLRHFVSGDYYQGINDAMFAIMKKIGGEFANESYKPVYSVDHTNIHMSYVKEDRLEMVFVLALFFLAF
ncbi:MAG: TPM domain-containing protein [Desulfobacterales bacterium]|nr:TPM domain-containing protein [Desulfobacterales bacterium]